MSVRGQLLDALDQIRLLEARLYVRPGLSPEAAANLEGRIAAFSEAGLPDRASEVAADMAEMQRIAVNLGVVITRQM